MKRLNKYRNTNAEPVGYCKQQTDKVREEVVVCGRVVDVRTHRHEGNREEEEKTGGKSK